MVSRCDGELDVDGGEGGRRGLDGNGIGGDIGDTCVAEEERGVPLAVVLVLAVAAEGQIRIDCWTW